MSNYQIPSVSNTCSILTLIVQAGQGLSRNDIAQTLNIPRTTAYRILKTLCEQNFLEHRHNCYFPGGALHSLGLSLSSMDRLRPLIRPVLNSLAEHTHFTSHLAIPSGFKVLLLEVCDSHNLLRVASRAGSLVPLHASATGKLFLAHLFSNDLEIIESEVGFASFTQNTLTGKQQIKKEIQVTLKRGYALDDREFNDNVRCLAAPVMDASGTVVAALGVTSPIALFPKKDMPTIAATLQAHARRCYQLIKGQI